MRYIFLVAILLLLPVTAITAQKQFESGFDSATAVDQSSVGWSRLWMEGTDATSGDDWETDIQAISETLVTAQFLGSYDNTWTTHSYAEIAADPEDAGNDVLHFEHVDGYHTGSYWNSSRLSMAMFFNQSVATGFSEGYVKYKMRLSDLTVFESRADQVDWYMIMEQIGYYNALAEFSITFNISKAWGIGEKFYWVVGIRDYDEGVGPAAQAGDFWTESNTSVAVPLESWFTLEVYIKKGTTSTGRLQMWITPDGGSRTEVFDITDLTQDDLEADAYTNDWQIFKMYNSGDLADIAATAGEPIEIWYDDFEYWDGLPGFSMLTIMGVSL